MLVVTASSHRQAAFAAAEFLMDYLKTRAPFWKQVEKPTGAAWVEAKTADDVSSGAVVGAAAKPRSREIRQAA